MSVLVVSAVMLVIVLDKMRIQVINFGVTVLVASVSS